MYSFEYDNGTGILRVRMTGFWTVDIAARYAAEVVQHTCEARRTAGSLRYLIDASQHPAQTPQVLDRLREARALAIESPNDKVAICLSSALARNLVSRHTSGHHTQIFSSLSAARSWLLERVDLLPAAYGIPVSPGVHASAA